MKLNFPEFELQIKREKGKLFVFDRLRKKYVVLSPEEWVRQHLVHYLIELGYPQGLMGLERNFPNSKKRFDLLVFNNSGNPVVLAECKSPDVNLNQSIITQVTSYLQLLDVPYLILTNGLKHYFFSREENEVKAWEHIPKFSALSN